MMEYNGYYPVQPGQPPPQQTMMNNQHDCTMMAGHMMPSNGPMLSSPAPSTPQSMRQTPGPHPMQHIQPQHMNHPMNPQQQPSPHPGYHQLPNQPPLSHSASPHPSTTPHTRQPPPRPSTGPSPLHLQSPIHMNGPSPKIQTHGPTPPQSQIGNQMPPVMTGGQPPPVAPNQPPQMQPHGHGFPNQPIAHHHPNPHYVQPQVNHHMPHQPPPVNHGPPPQGGQILGPPPPPGYMPSHSMHHMNQDRGSPMYQHIPQTEYRIIELNKRLLSRPRSRGLPSPLPLPWSCEETIWWERFACDFFDDDSTLTLRIPSEDRHIEYSVSRTLIPRFFRSYFDGGVTDFTIKLRNIRETPQGPGSVTLDCDQADIITKNFVRHSNVYTNVVVHTEGHLSLGFINNNFGNLVIKSWRFYANQCHEYIDRSMTNTGLSRACLINPVSRFGLTKSTSAFLKMCMIMEPMQELMAHHRQTKMDPKSCLKHLTYDRYKLKTVEENRVQPNKRRKRKAPASGTTGPNNKKSKANANTINGANALGSNMGIPDMMPPDGMVVGMSLASQDVLVVGEPSMLDADFGDENERRITRLENNQYDPSMDSNQQNISSNVSQMNQSQIQINSTTQSNLANHDASGNSVGSMLGFTNHSTDATEQHCSVNNNGMNDNNLGAPHDGNNCIAADDSSNPNDMNNQMNYAMNSETNHIVKTEMDLHSKQTITPTQMTESEAR